jgi:UDP-N-acetyl-2-amino-2-deoxyglucuronate dehydrogenase
MAEQKLKFALVGCGRISGKHIEAISGLYNEAELTCVCDIIKERACKKATEYVNLLRNINIDANSGSDLSDHSSLPESSGTRTYTSPKYKEPRVYTDLSDMLDHEPVDVLSICTPSGLHPVHGIMAAKRHIHVLTEKPMAVSLDMADALIRECDGAGVKLFVVLQNRLNSTVRLLKKAVDTGRFGKIYSLFSNVLWLRPQSYYDEAEWRGTHAMDGGAFLNQACHYADSLQWLGGPIDSVTAMVDTLARRIQCEDTGSAVIKFKSGAIGNLNVSMLTFPGNLEGSLTILGQKGTVRLGGVALNKIVEWSFDEWDKDDELVTASSYDPPDIYGLGHIGYYSNVLKALKGNIQPDTDGPEGRKSLELISAIYKSSNEGRTVKLPLLTDGEIVRYNFQFARKHVSRKKDPNR